MRKRREEIEWMYRDVAGMGSVRCEEVRYR